MLKKFLASVATLVLGVGLAATTGALASNAVDVDDSSKCITSTIHHDAVAEVHHKEYQYEKVIPGHDSNFHIEYRFRTRTVTYGYVEHKYIYSAWNFVDGGMTLVNGHLVSGTWVKTGTVTWHAIADSVINAVWGSGGIPDNLIGGSETNPKDTVSLSSYGAPSGPGGAGTAPYYATKVLNPSGFTEWGPFSAWSTTDPGAESETLDVETQKVSNNDSVPDTYLYYLHGGEPTDTLTAANWTTDSPATVDASWTKIHFRKVIDVQAKDAYDENVYGDCPADPCTTVGTTWFTEDIAPTETAGGLLFSGPNAAAVDYYHAVSGNLEGVVGSSYTITSAGGYHAALVYEIYMLGTTGYATISIEPYQNGWAPGQTGTFTVTHTTKVWTSKIPSGLGSQSQPATIDQMSAIFPLNKLITQGLHLGTNSVEGQFTTVSQITGCGDLSFVDPPTVSCDNNVDGNNLYLPAIEGVLWSVNGDTPTAGPRVVPLSLSDVTIVASPASAAYKFGPGQTSWKFDADDAGICQIPTLADFPTNLTYTDQMCTEGKTVQGTITVGKVEGVNFFSPYVDYFLDGSLTPMTTQTVSVAPGVHHVTAAPHDPDDSLEGATEWTITIASAGRVCTELTTLAFTGSASPAPWVALGTLMFGAGLALIVIRSRRRESTDAE